MCTICNKHGEGKKWYLVSKFYSEELEKSGRREFLLRFVYERFENYFSKGMRYLGMTKAIPLIGEGIEGIVEVILRKEHYGQVIPIEDIPKVFDLATSIYKYPCVCKIVMRGWEDQSHCIGFGMFPENYFKAYQDYSEHTEKITKEEALDLVKNLQNKGYIQSIWTYRTPYVGKLCNCDLPDCAAFTTQLNFGTNIIYKSEYIFKIEETKCTGCKNCKKFCQFGAIEYLPKINVCRIDGDKCFGCGVCRIGCKKEAIVIFERPSILQTLLGEERKIRREYKIIVDKNKCKTPLNCRKCLELCPRSVFLVYPLFKREKDKRSEIWQVSPSYSVMCTGCMECENFCPNNAIKVN